MPDDLASTPNDSVGNMDDITASLPSAGATATMDAPLVAQDTPDAAQNATGAPAAIVDAPPAIKGYESDPEYIAALERSKRYESLDAYVEKFGGADSIRELLEKSAPDIEAVGGVKDYLARADQEREAQSQREAAEVRSRDEQFRANLASMAENQAWSGAVAKAEVALGYKREDDPAGFDRLAGQLYWDTRDSIHQSFTNAHDQRMMALEKVKADYPDATPEILNELVWSPTVTPQQVLGYAKVTHESAQRAAAPLRRELAQLRSEYDSYKATEAARLQSAEDKGRIAASAQYDANANALPVEGAQGGVPYEKRSGRSGELSWGELIKERAQAAFGR